jgi:hypothetical protein
MISEDWRQGANKAKIAVTMRPENRLKAGVMNWNKRFFIAVGIGRWLEETLGRASFTSVPEISKTFLATISTGTPPCDATKISPKTRHS